jgi:hypothetical protein
VKRHNKRVLEGFHSLHTAQKKKLIFPTGCSGESQQKKLFASSSVFRRLCKKVENCRRFVVRKTRESRKIAFTLLLLHA